jgi:hypothetical protein
MTNAEKFLFISVVLAHLAPLLALLLLAIAVTVPVILARAD